MHKIFKGLAEYLTNWKNLLVHSLIGVGILAIALFLPVRPIYRIGILLIVIIANILRMRWEKALEKRDSD